MELRERFSRDYYAVCTANSERVKSRILCNVQLAPPNVPSVPLVQENMGIFDKGDKPTQDESVSSTDDSPNKKGLNDEDNRLEAYDEIPSPPLEEIDDSDADPDFHPNSEVSVEEWAQMWDEYSKNPDNALEWQTQYLRFMFELEDASGDGSIDAAEFTSVCSCYGLDTQECKEAFEKMAQGKKEVNYDQFVALWKQFFTSEIPSDSGNFIFGKTKF